MTYSKSSKNGDITGHQQVRQAGKLRGGWHGWMIPPIRIDVMLGRYPLSPLAER